MKIKLRYIPILISLFFFLSSIVACSSQSASSSLAHTWHRINGKNTMTFYEDGTTRNVDSHSDCSDILEYKIQEDGTLILVMDWGGDMYFDETTSALNAMDDWKLYYLQDNVLIYATDVYYIEDNEGSQKKAKELFDTVGTEYSIQKKEEKAKAELAQAKNLFNNRVSSMKIIENWNDSDEMEIPYAIKNAVSDLEYLINSNVAEEHPEDRIWIDGVLDEEGNYPSGEMLIVSPRTNSITYSENNINGVPEGKTSQIIILFNENGSSLGWIASTSTYKNGKTTGKSCSISFSKSEKWGSPKEQVTRGIVENNLYDGSYDYSFKQGEETPRLGIETFNKGIIVPVRPMNQEEIEDRGYEGNVIVETTGQPITLKPEYMDEVNTLFEEEAYKPNSQ